MSLARAALALVATLVIKIDGATPGTVHHAAEWRTGELSSHILKHLIDAHPLGRNQQ